MSVKKVGNDEGVKKRVTCESCGSILSYLPRDVTEYTTADYTGDTNVYRYISCPECNEKVYVPSW